MEKENIIQQEVKNGLSEFGLNEEERKDYENLILEQIKDTQFEKEEDLVTDIKSRVQSFVPSVKLLQKRTTKLGQEKSEVLRQFEEYKKKNPLHTDDNKKDDGNNGIPDWAKSLFEGVVNTNKEVANIKKEREEEKKAKELKEKKSAVLSALKSKYNKQFYTTIDALSTTIDWSKEDAENNFKDLLSNLAKDNPAYLAVSDGRGDKDKKENLLIKYMSVQDDKERQEDFKKRLV